MVGLAEYYQNQDRINFEKGQALRQGLRQDEQLGLQRAAQDQRARQLDLQEQGLGLRATQGQQNIDLRRGELNERLQDKMIKMVGGAATLLGTLGSIKDPNQREAMKPMVRNNPMFQIANRDGAYDKYIDDYDALQAIMPSLANIAAAAQGKTPLADRAQKIQENVDAIDKYAAQKAIDLQTDPEKARRTAELTAPYKQNKGMSMRVDPATGEVMLSQGGDTSAFGTSKPTRSTQSELQKDVIGSMELLGDLDAVKDSFTPSNLTAMGKAYNALNLWADKFGVAFDPNSIQQNVKFRNNVKQYTNAYRKEITGAAAAEKELKMIEDSIINTNMGPEEFKAALSQLESKTKRGLRLKRRVLREGIQVGSEEFGKRLDELYLGNEDDDKNARLLELKPIFLQKAGSVDEARNMALQQLKKEGYAI